MLRNNRRLPLQRVSLEVKVTWPTQTLFCQTVNRMMRLYRKERRKNLVATSSRELAPQKRERNVFAAWDNFDPMSANKLIHLFQRLYIHSFDGLSVPCERAFSKAGELASKKRNRWKTDAGKTFTYFNKYTSSNSIHTLIFTFRYSLILFHSFVRFLKASKIFYSYQVI